jgi:glycosyltransferase involved in cell wall biosynthesis
VPRKVLFVQHAGALGGSAMSLLYTALALDAERYTPIVALVRPSEPLVRLYREAGLPTIVWTGIQPWDHSTVSPQRLHNPASWRHLASVAAGWSHSRRRTLELVEQVRPDLVHLNSMPLSPCAAALTDVGFPTVWHVREPPEPAFGMRYRMIRSLMLEVDELVFISDADRSAWVDGQRGEMIHNFVDFDVFDSRIPAEPTRTALGLRQDDPVVLFLGGAIRVKGVHPLLQALALLRPRFPGLRCLMPGSISASGSRAAARIARRALPLIGTGTAAQRVEQAIRRLDLEDVCVRMPFRQDVPQLMAASDVLVFPAVRPHFARPVIEAGAMARPVVASRIAGVAELVRDGETGILTAPGSGPELAAALGNILGDSALRARLGEAGQRHAQARFDARRQVARIMAIYDRLLDARQSPNRHSA